jgi:hypothetical protein
LKRRRGVEREFLMNKVTRAFVLAAGALLSGCVVVPGPYSAASHYGGEAMPAEVYPAEVYPAYVAPWNFGLYFGWPYGYDVPGYRYGHGGPHGRSHRGWGSRGYRGR